VERAGGQRSPRAKRNDSRKGGSIVETPSERKTIRVTIYNQPYTLAVTGETGEVEALARSVDELMTEIAQRAGNVDATRVAVLACLHLGDRLRNLERELSDLKNRLGEKSRQFSILLDAAMK
jgi:cell division protein ZapA